MDFAAQVGALEDPMPMDIASLVRTLEEIATDRRILQDRLRLCEARNETT